HRAVAGDLIMLDGLRGGDEAGIEGIGALRLVHDLLALGDDAFDGLARHAGNAFVHQLEHLFKTLDVVLGLLFVLLERLSQLGRVRLLGHFRQRFEDGLLSGVHVLEEVCEELVERIHRHWETLSCPDVVTASPSPRQPLCSWCGERASRRPVLTSHDALEAISTSMSRIPRRRVVASERAGSEVGSAADHDRVPWGRATGSRVGRSPMRRLPVGATERRLSASVQAYPSRPCSDRGMRASAIASPRMGAPPVSKPWTSRGTQATRAWSACRRAKATMRCASGPAGSMAR